MKKGLLAARDNIQSKTKFLGCSNYPMCDYTVKDLELLNNKKICPICGGYMVRRKGSYGSFYGCSKLSEM